MALNKRNPFTSLSRFTLLFILLGVAVQTVPASERLDTDYANTVHTLLQRAQSKGETPVIIRLNVATRPEGELATDAAKQAQRNNINTTQNRLLENLSIYAIKRIKKFKHLPYIAVKMDAAGLEAALADPNVVQVYEDRLSAATLAESAPLVGATAAWSSGYSGNGQVVAVLDTGVESSHSFLSGKVVHEACFSTNFAQDNASTVCPNGQEQQTGSGAGEACTVPSGCNHGTHVAGIVAGKGTGGITFSGVARDADIMAIQVFSRFDDPDVCTYGSPCVLSFTSDQISALEHVFGQKDNFDIAAVNMSLGGGYYASTCDSDPTKAAIDLLRSVGIATIVASGNDGYTNGISSPACISSAISVGSSTKSDGVSSFSNSAQILDILAPGSSINSSVTGNGFASFNGTSMATPHVAGAFALLRSKAPVASVAEILNALQSTGVAITDSRNGIAKYRIQVDAALDMVGVPPTTGVLSLSPSEGLSTSGAEGGPFTPATKAYTLTNTGTESIDFSVSESVAWAAVSLQTGTLAPGNNRVITVSINSAADSLSAGDYATAISFTNTTNGQGSTTRALNLTVTGAAAANDKFSDGILLQQSSGSTQGSNQNASKEIGEPNHSEANGGRSLWWRWIAPTAGEVTFDTVGSNFDTTLGAYTGTNVAALIEEASDDDTYDLQSEVEFQTEAGVTYHIAVDGYSGASGDISLNWSFTQDTTPQINIAVSPESGFTTTGPEGGSFSPISITYTLTNVSSSAQSFQVLNIPGWLTPSTTSGTLAPGAGTTVVLTVDNSANSFPPGNHTGAVLFNDVSRSMQLVVTSTGLIGNDPFIDAEWVSGVLPGTKTGTNVDASKEAGEPDHGGNPGGRSVWWRWTAQATGTVEIDTFGSTFDTTLGVYTGAQVADLTTLASNDDTAGGLQSQISFSAITGTTYYIAVDGFNGANGAITLNLALATGVAPVNDNFDNALPLSGIPLSTTGSNSGASKEAGEPNHADNTGGRSVWWRWTAQATGTVEIDTFGSAFDTTLGVYTGAHVAGLTTLAGSDDAGGLQSQVSFSAIAGTTYYIAVDGFSGEYGAITLNLALATGVAPVNDNFNNALPLSGIPLSTTGSNGGASKEAGEPNHADGSGGRSVWWRWTAQATETIEIDTFGSTFDTTLGVYTGAQVAGLTTIASNDDSAGEWQSQVSFPAITGTTYYIAVDGYDGQYGAITLNLTSTVPPVNDNFNNALPLSGIPLSTTGSNGGASKEAGEPNHADDTGGRSVWWRWTAQATGTVEINTFGSTFDTTLGVYTGTQVNNLTTIASNNDSTSPPQSQVSFQALAGTAYYLAVDGYSGGIGDVALNILGATVTNYTLQVNTVGHGSVTSNPVGIICPSDCTEDYADGATIELTAAADSGWGFVGWSGDCVGTGSCTLPMSGHKNVTATFAGMAAVMSIINAILLNDE